jgi:hypothetical protein
MHYTARALTHIVAFAAVLAVNYLSNALPLNGKTPGELSDQYPNLFVPAGLTFSIWGIIYLLLLAWTVALVAGLFNSNLRSKTEVALQKTGWLFPLTCALNIAWLFAWHWQFIPLSVGIMVALLLTLLRLNERAGTGRTAANALEKWLAHPAYGLYQGWITVALIANVTALLVSVGFTGGTAAPFWAAGMVVVGGGLAAFMVLKTNNVFHGLAVLWALLGIYLKRSAAGDADSMVVAWTAVVMMGVVAVAVGWRWFGHIRVHE